MMSRGPLRWLTWFGAVFAAWVLCLPIMLASTMLRNLLGTRGLTAVERLMGLLLVTIAVEMMMGGVLEFWHAHNCLTNAGLRPRLGAVGERSHSRFLHQPGLGPRRPPLCAFLWPPC